MGRIKTKLIKRHGQDLVDKYGDNFSANFDENKKIITEYAEIRSNKLRNVIAGYITRMVKTGKHI